MNYIYRLGAQFLFQKQIQINFQFRNNIVFHYIFIVLFYKYRRFILPRG